MNNPYSIKANINLYSSNTKGITPTSSSVSKKSKNINLSFSNDNEEEEIKSIKTIKTLRGKENIDDIHKRKIGVYNIKKPNEKTSIVSNVGNVGIVSISNQKHIETETTLKRTINAISKSKYDIKENIEVNELKAVKNSTSILKPNNYVKLDTKLTDVGFMNYNTIKVENDRLITDINDFHNQSNYRISKFNSLTPSLKTSNNNLFIKKEIQEKGLAESDIKNTQNTFIKMGIPKFNIEAFTLTQDLTETIYGKIYKSFDFNGKEFAMLRFISSNSSLIEKLFSQIELTSKYKHDFIQEIFGLSISKIDRSLISFNVLMEKYDYDLETHISQMKNNQEFYKEEEILLILKSIVGALGFLQENNAYHGFLSPKSILLTCNNEENTLNVMLSLPQIYDPAINPLNLSFQNKLLKDLMKSNELYLSPILFSSYSKNKYDSIKHNPAKSDTFSLGMIMLHVATLSTKPLFLVRARMDSDSIKKIIVSFMKGKYSSQLIDLIISLLSLDEKKRLTYLEIDKKINDILSAK